MTIHRGNTQHAGFAHRRKRASARSSFFSAVLFRFRPRADLLEDRTLLSSVSFLVDTTSDSGPGSLHQAILDANAATGGASTIDFAIPGQGVQVIQPVSPLPAITEPVLIDGFSQPGYGGTPLIELSGTQAGTGDGLMITSSDVTVRGLDINGFASGAGVHITGTAATGDWIYGNFLGTDPTGTQAAPNNYGVEIDSGASDNLIGTNGDGVNDAAEQNVVSGNSVAGVWINGRGTDGNVVAGNLIGTSVTGDTAVGNGSHPTGTIWSYYYGGGLLIQNGASGNLVGTDGRGVDIAGERNVISGNGDGGITITGPGTSGNVVAGDLIGTSVSGDLALGNHSAMGWYYRYTQADGVMLVDGAALNTIGGTAPGTGCVISGNGGAGVEIAGSGTSGNVVEGNVIGTSVTGDTALPNGGGSFPAYYYYPSGTCDGAVDISGASSNTVGGTAAGAGNVISENYGAGVVVTGNGSAGDAIIGNSIYDNSGQAIDLGDDGVTYDATSPRQGPNNFQNFPLIFSVAGGGLEGSLAGSTPDATFLIDLYASTAITQTDRGKHRITSGRWT